MKSKKDTNLNIKVESELKAAYLDAIQRDISLDRNISTVTRGLMEAYIDLVNRYPGRKLPPYKLCGHDELEGGNKPAYPTAPSLLRRAAEQRGKYKAGRIESQLQGKKA